MVDFEFRDAGIRIEGELKRLDVITLLVIGINFPRSMISAPSVSVMDGSFPMTKYARKCPTSFAAMVVTFFGQ